LPFTECRDIKLSGTVKDADGQAVADAHVSLKHFPRLRVRTDESGAFSLTGTSTGSFSSDTITAVARGFRSGIIAVSSYENNDIAFVLAKSNTWKPVGDLQHKGNMVLIKAKGYDFEMGQPNDTIRGLYFDEPTTGLSSRYIRSNLPMISGWIRQKLHNWNMTLL
jgi:hypothetical protein